MDFAMPSSSPEEYLNVYYSDNEKGGWRIYGDPALTNYFPGWNVGFNYDDEINDWLDRIWMSSPVLKKFWISKISAKSQNVNYPFIYAYQTGTGWAIWDCWELNLYADPQSGVLKDIWGGINAQFIKWKGCPKETKPIPGYSLFITVSLISILGVIYIMKQKKKLSALNQNIIT
jgi:hypothetical protein